MIVLVLTIQDGDDATADIGIHVNAPLCDAPTTVEEQVLAQVGARIGVTWEMLRGASVPRGLGSSGEMLPRDPEPEVTSETPPAASPKSIRQRGS